MEQKNRSLKELPFVMEGGHLQERSAAEYLLINGQQAAVLDFGLSRVAGILQNETGLYNLCLSLETSKICCNGNLWILPQNNYLDKTVCISGEGEKSAQAVQTGVEIVLASGCYTLTVYIGWPSCDIFGKRLSLQMKDGEKLEQTYARFYWDTLLPSVIEQTDALVFPISEGYVLSTLEPGKYAGTYPDVDHEFQCKGRIALRGGCELAVVERMMNLQFRMMREDPAGLWRNPCAVQPKGEREYHVRRDSMDRSANAEMFLVTGNVEILETAWLYYAATKDSTWLHTHIKDLEGAASLLEHLTDHNGKLWSDVFYEDQVIKDGMECMSAALAAHALELLAELEQHLGRSEAETRFRGLANKIARSLIKPLPHGFWNEEHLRFADWIDRNGKVHDHIHLLANCLPVLFGYAAEEQAQAVKALIEENFEEFQRFPTFLSPCIADYTPDEIGCAGPYDLCAAGRYWCWDAAYWAFLGRGDVLGHQLMQVAAQAKTDGYHMGERYDMNHVYYKDHKNWHGAAYYYEYPCVFLWVLLQEFLGLRQGIDVDVELRPALDRFGTVIAENYGIEYEYGANEFAVKNTASRSQTLRLQLQALYPGKKLYLKDVELSGESIFQLDAGASLNVSVDTDC
ncbi:MAG TPA: hypothetical protein GXX75_21890 [Clostridiales bacterium]|nr:hypothetical protein [Clostridiales bacterium]